MKRLLYIVGIVVVVSIALFVFFPNRIPLSQGSSRTMTPVTHSQTLQDLIAGKVVVSVQGVSFGEQKSPRMPIRLKIPSINVDAALEYVGLASDGTMDVPKNPDNVAWFELGSHPGESGSAVMAGHYGRKDGRGSVFDNLHTLRTGDTIYVENDEGTTVTFVVRESRRYDPRAASSEVFGSDDGKAHLNLITCEGVWDTAAGGYTKRLVVFTDKVE